MKIGAKYALPPMKGFGEDVKSDSGTMLLASQPSAPSHVTDVIDDISELLREFRLVRPNEYPIIFIDEVGRCV